MFVIMQRENGSCELYDITGDSLDAVNEVASSYLSEMGMLKEIVRQGHDVLDAAFVINTPEQEEVLDDIEASGTATFVEWLADEGKGVQLENVIHVSGGL